MPHLSARRMKDAESKKGKCEHLCVEILSDLLNLLSPKSCRAVFEKIVRLKMNKLLKHSVLRIGGTFVCCYVTVHRAGDVFRP